MRREPFAKPNQRFVMYIPNTLREDIENWVNKRGITLAQFGREAFETYLNNKRREERNAQLAETCRIFDVKNNQFTEEWNVNEHETWPV